LFSGLFIGTGKILQANLSDLQPGTQGFLGSSNAFLLSGYVEPALLPAAVSTLDSQGMMSLTAPDGSFILPFEGQPDANGLQQIMAVARSLNEPQFGMAEAIEPLLGMAVGWVGPLPPPTIFTPVPFEPPVKISTTTAISQEICKHESFMSKMFAKYFAIDKILNQFLDFFKSISYPQGKITPNPLCIPLGEIRTLSIDASSIFNAQTVSQSFPVVVLPFPGGLKIGFCASVQSVLLKVVDTLCRVEDNTIANGTAMIQVMTKTNANIVVPMKGLKKGTTKFYVAIRPQSLKLRVKPCAESPICKDSSYDVSYSFHASLKPEVRGDLFEPVDILVGDLCTCPYAGDYFGSMTGTIIPYDPDLPPVPWDSIFGFSIDEQGNVLGLDLPGNVWTFSIDNCLGPQTGIHGTIDIQPYNWHFIVDGSISLSGDTASASGTWVATFDLGAGYGTWSADRDFPFSH
jgi:hypothetical protein